MDYSTAHCGKTIEKLLDLVSCNEKKFVNFEALIESIQEQLAILINEIRHQTMPTTNLIQARAYHILDLVIITNVDLVKDPYFNEMLKTVKCILTEFVEKL